MCQSRHHGSCRRGYALTCRRLLPAMVPPELAFAVPDVAAATISGVHSQVVLVLLPMLRLNHRPEGCPQTCRFGVSGPWLLSMRTSPGSCRPDMRSVSPATTGSLGSDSLADLVSPLSPRRPAFRRCPPPVRFGRVHRPSLRLTPCRRYRARLVRKRPASYLEAPKYLPIMAHGTNLEIEQIQTGR